VKPLVALNLSDDLDLGTLLGKQVLDVLYITCLSGKRSSHKVDSMLEPKVDDNLLVLLAERRKVDDGPRKVDFHLVLQNKIIFAVDNNVILKTVIRIGLLTSWVSAISQ